MRYLKMLGLAAVAAMALTAFFGAGSASATVLCKTTLTTGCAGAWDHPSGTEVHAVLDAGEHATLIGFWANVTCRTSTVRGETTSTGSSSTTVTGHIDELTFGECDCGGTPGTAHVTTIANGTVEVHSISGSHNSTMTGAGT